MDKSKVQTKEVWSANKWYLYQGIISVIMIILLEGCAIYQFFVEPLGAAIALTMVLQLPVSVCLLFATTIKDWKERTKFNIYYIKLETSTDIDYIKQNYSVEDISTRGILFVEKEDSHNFSTWNLLQGYKYMWEIEDRWFGQ